MQFWLSWQFFAAVLVVFAWAVYGLIGAARQIERHRAINATPPGRPLTWRMIGYALFVGGPLVLAIPCLFKNLGIELTGLVAGVVLALGVLDILAGGFFLIAADSAGSR